MKTATPLPTTPITEHARVRSCSEHASVRSWLGGALVLSIVLHLVMLFVVPQLEMFQPRAAQPSASQPPIDARIVIAKPAPEQVAAVAPPALPLPKPRPRAVVPKPPPEGVSMTPRESAAVPAPPSMTDSVPDPTSATPPQDLTTAELLGEQAATSPDTPTQTAQASPLAKPDQPDSVDPAPVVATPDTTAPVVLPSPDRAYPLKLARLVYDVAYGFGGSVMGRTTHTFKIDGDNYDVETVVEGIGLVRIFYGGRYVQRSRGRITAQGFVPDEYFVMRGREDRSERAQFNWTDKRVTFTWRDETRTADLQPGMQDPVSVLHQLYFMQPLEKNAKLSIATSRKLSEYGYEVVGEESIQTPIGAIPTIRVRRTDEETVQFVMWLDPARNMMPMRMYYEDRNRTVLEQTIREYTVEAGPAR